MRQTTLGYLLKHFTSAKDKTELESTFKKLDTNGDGFLSKDELRDGYKEMFGADFNQKDLEELIEVADINSDGKLSYQEWVTAAMNRE
jgi:calcium-dependent protein kinase